MFRTMFRTQGVRNYWDVIIKQTMSHNLWINEIQVQHR